MSKRKTNKRVYARIISMGMLIRWQLTAILVGLVVNIGLTWYHHEMTMLKLDTFKQRTVVSVKICNEIGWNDCMKVYKIVKESNQ